MRSPAGSSQPDEAWVADRFPVLPDELDCLRPDVVIFLSGPNYDGVLGSVLPGVRLVEVPGASVRELARVVHSRLPAHSYRTYHPAYLRRQSRWALLDEVVRLCGDA